MEQGSGFGWVIIAIGVFICWLAWGRKKNKARGMGGPVIFVPVSTVPRRRQNWLVIVILIVAFMVVWHYGKWLLDHPLPPVR